MIVRGSPGRLGVGAVAVMAGRPARRGLRGEGGGEGWWREGGGGERGLQREGNRGFVMGGEGEARGICTTIFSFMCLFLPISILRFSLVCGKGKGIGFYLFDQDLDSEIRRWKGIANSTRRFSRKCG